MILPARCNGWTDERSSHGTFDKKTGKRVRTARGPAQRSKSAQRGQAAAEAERDRSPVAAAPHEAGGLGELGVLLRAGPLRAGTARAPPIPQIRRSPRTIPTIAVQGRANARMKTGVGLQLKLVNRDRSELADGGGGISRPAGH